MTHIVNMLEPRPRCRNWSVSRVRRREPDHHRAQRTPDRAAGAAAPIAVDRGRRIGVANGRFEVPEPDVALDAEVQRLLKGWAP